MKTQGETIPSIYEHKMLVNPSLKERLNKRLNKGSVSYQSEKHGYWLQYSFKTAKTMFLAQDMKASASRELRKDLNLSEPKYTCRKCGDKYVNTSRICPHCGENEWN